jgi:DNA primase
MQDNWVDFKAVKAVVSMQMLLDRYKINWLRKSGKDLRGRCPIHKGDGQGAFNVNITKNAFNCFSCQARGNVLDFVAAMEQCSVRDAGLKLKEWYSISSEPPLATTKTKPAAGSGGAGEKAAAENKPLTFQLKGVDPNHPYLAERGISRETADTFGIGFFGGKGSMNGRVVIPIHNQRGQLVAYAGRAIEGSEPRYKLPVGFHKSAELFNLHRVTAQEVILVEGFFDCMKVWQSSNPFVVALMGNNMSQQQEKIITARFKRVTILLDGDDAGRKAAEGIASRLIHKLHVRIIDLPDGKQPDEFPAEKLTQVLNSV